MFHRTHIDPALKTVTFRRKPRVVALTGDIGEAMVPEFELSLSRAVDSGQQCVPVLIHSAGGCVYTALRIVDMLNAAPVRVVTVIAGCAMSAAALVFSCGDERYIAPHGTLMLHDVTLDMGEGPTKVSDVEIESNELRRVNSAMWRVMSRNIGKADTFFPEVLHAQNVDAYVTPAVAKQWNLATHIGTPLLTTTVTCSTSLSMGSPSPRRSTSGTVRRADGASGSRAAERRSVSPAALPQAVAASPLLRRQRKKKKRSRKRTRAGTET